MLDLLSFAPHLDGARLVVTGEGRLDEQTLHGKAPAGVAAAAGAPASPARTAQVPSASASRHAPAWRGSRPKFVFHIASLLP